MLCSQVALLMWKAKYLSDTEEEPGLSSEDEVTGLPPHRAVAGCLPLAHGGVPMPLPAPQPILLLRVPTATGMYWIILPGKLVACYLL